MLFIIPGQKYMGQWLDDNRHGNGLVVTLDGYYFEGNFTNGKMSVSFWFASTSPWLEELFNSSSAMHPHFLLISINKHFMSTIIVTNWILVEVIEYQVLLVYYCTSHFCHRVLVWNGSTKHTRAESLVCWFPFTWASVAEEWQLSLWCGIIGSSNPGMFTRPSNAYNKYF